jgi:hypothetical protein
VCGESRMHGPNGGIGRRTRRHRSRIYDTRVMRRLDKTAQAKLQQLISHFGVSKANIIRRLIMQATDEDFPASWQMRAAARRVRLLTSSLINNPVRRPSYLIISY